MAEPESGPAIGVMKWGLTHIRRRGKRSPRAARRARLPSMIPRLAVILSLALLAASLGGCTKCGFIWDDLGHSCHSDAPR